MSKPKAGRSIKDLKLEIEKLKEAYNWNCSAALGLVSVAINSFEEGLKARRDEWKKIDASVKWHYSKKREHQGRILELERILDGGG